MLERIGARRVLLIAALGVAVLVGAIAATNLQSQAVYYLTPSEAKAQGVAAGQTVRLGGLVKAGSMSSADLRGANDFRFVITDGTVEVHIVATGAIPGLLREGAGAVVEGAFVADGTFLATQVIAKHNEVYTAPTAGATPAHRTSFP
ncbi:MAG: cytochrome c maturation protein CcmE [Chloroflexota bacterium]|nr:cytochrome c maturation protein CcmE [Chloroflexota bacterium]